MNSQANSIQTVVWALNFDFELVAYVTDLCIGGFLAKSPFGNENISRIHNCFDPYETRVISLNFDC